MRVHCKKPPFLSHRLMFQAASHSRSTQTAAFAQRTIELHKEHPQRAMPEMCINTEASVTVNMLAHIHPSAILLDL